MSEHARASTAPGTPEPSNPGMQLPPVHVPQLPPALARHPILAAIVLMVCSVSSTIGGVYAVQQEPKDNTAQIDAMSERFDDRLDTIEIKLQRNEDQLSGRIERLEEGARQTRQYHDALSRANSNTYRWQDRVINRLDRLEAKK